MNPQQPNYDFITQGTKNKSPFFSPRTTKQRVMLVSFLAGSLIVIAIAISLVVNIFKVDNTQKLVDLAAYQNEIQRIMDLGANGSTTGSTKIYAQIASTTFESHKQTTIKLATKKNVKISAKQLLKSKSTTIDKKLDAAKNSNTFNEVFQKIYEEQIAAYEEKLKTLSSDESDKDIKSALLSYHKNTSIMSMDYKPPTSQP